MAWFKRSKADDSAEPEASPISAPPAVAELTDAERAWIDAHLNALTAIGIHDIDGLGSRYDQQLTEWLGASDSERPDPNEMINRLGVGFGEYVRRASDTRWVIASDQFGTELALHGEPGNILMFPTNMVAKRWVAGEVGALPALASATVRSIEEFRRRSAL